MVVTDPKMPGGRRASSAAFQDDNDGSSMSTYLESVVSHLHIGADSVVYGKPTGWAVASIPVVTLIAENQRVVRDPIVGSPDPHPCDPAHALVHGVKDPKGRRERISRASPLVYVVP